jgi:hypothetical protein
MHNHAYLRKLSPLTSSLDPKKGTTGNLGLGSPRGSPLRSGCKLNHKDPWYPGSKGIETIRDPAFDFIRSRMAPTYPKDDGTHPLISGPPVWIAQHPRATCWRDCIQKRHEIKETNPFREMVEGGRKTMRNEWWRRGESNPRPEIVHSSIYMHSPNFNFRP